MSAKAALRVFANQAGTSWPKPAAVHEAVASALHTDPGRAWETIVPTVRAQIGSLLGVPTASTERIMLTAGCTSAMSTMLTDLPWRAGDVVVTSSLEHHALERVLRQLERDRGVEVAFLPYSVEDPFGVDAMPQILSSGRVRLVAMSHASSVTGDVVDLEMVASRAHQHGARLMVDAAQSVGVVPISAERMGVDMIAFGGHKGLLGPHGIGGFYTNSEVEFEHLDDPEGAATSAPHSYCDLGSIPYATLSGLGAGIGHLQSRPNGIHSVHEHIQTLTTEFITLMKELEGVTCHGGTDATKRTGVVSLTLRNGRAPDELGAWLAADGIVINASTQCAPMAHDAIGTTQHGGTARVSFGAQSSAEDVLAVADSIRGFLQT